MYLFAQEPMPTPSMHDLGVVVMGVAVILLALDRFKAIFWPTVSHEEAFVRHIELEEIKTRMDNFVTRLELQRLEQQMISLAQDHKDLAKVSSAKYDEMCKAVNELRVTIEQVRREIKEETGRAADRIINHVLRHGHRQITGSEEDS
jgi:hypothetical protein